MHAATLHLQFLLVAALSLLALAAAGTVLLIKGMQRREAAAERSHPGLAQARWRKQMQVWLRRYALAAAALAGALAIYGIVVFARA